MFDKFRDMLATKKQIDEDKEVVYEKGDYLALIIAAVSMMIPVLLLFFLFIALIVWIVF